MAIHAAFGRLEFDPVEILAGLAHARHAKAALAVFQLQQVLLGAEGQREAFRVQVAAMHRVREIVERVAIVHVPDGGAQEAGPVRIGQFGRERQGRGHRRLVGGHEDEDRVAVFGHVVGAQRLASLHRAIGHGGNLLHGACAIDHDAMIAAADVLAVDLGAVTQRRAPVRAEILDALHGPVRAAPQHQLLPQRHGAEGAVAPDLHRFGDRIPLIADAFVHAGLDPGPHLCRYCHRVLPSGSEAVFEICRVQIRVDRLQLGRQRLGRPVGPATGRSDDAAGGKGVGQGLPDRRSLRHRVP